MFHFRISYHTIVYDTLTKIMGDYQRRVRGLSFEDDNVIDKRIGEHGNVEYLIETPGWRGDSHKQWHSRENFAIWSWHGTRVLDEYEKLYKGRVHFLEEGNFLLRFLTLVKIFPLLLLNNVPSLRNNMLLIKSWLREGFKKKYGSFHMGGGSNPFRIFFFCILNKQIQSRNAF